MFLNKHYISWLAGFFDGEGSVSLSHSPNGSKTGNRIFRLQVTLSQKDGKYLREAQQLFGGRVVYHRHCNQWMTSGPVAAKFLRTVLPYLRVKRRVAELALLQRVLVDSGVTKCAKAAKRTEVSKVSMQIREAIMRENRATCPPTLRLRKD